MLLFHPLLKILITILFAYLFLFTFLFRMGACGSDLLEKLGPDFGKLVACEKGKEFIDQKIV